MVSEQELANTADQYIADMLATSPMGLRLTKDGLNLSVDAPSLDAAMALEDRQQALVASSADAREAINAFFGKNNAKLEKPVAAGDSRIFASPWLTQGLKRKRIHYSAEIRDAQSSEVLRDAKL